MNATHPALRRRPMPMDVLDAAEDIATAAPPRAYLIGLRRHLASEPGSAAMPDLQAMHMVMVIPGRRVGPDLAPPRPRIAIDALLPSLSPRTLTPANGHSLRPVTGEVLRNAEGQLFERHGERLRVLGRLLGGAQGQLFECVDAQPLDDTAETLCEVHPGTAQRPASVGRAARTSAPPPPRRERTALRERGASRRSASPKPPAEAARKAAATVQALLPAPGKWVQVAVGEFSALLQGQLAHPERVASDYQLGAWLQVFEADAELDFAEAARQVLGDPQAAAGLAPWTPALAQRFAVVLGSHAGAPPATGAKAQHIAPGQRFFALRVASDPTAVPVVGAESGNPSADTTLRSAVPAKWQLALPERVPRAQALARIQHAAPPPWWQRWQHRVGSSARAAWRQGLQGRTLDEQLWAVPPPVHGLVDAQVRDWAATTLRLAGYDASRMQDEWEIFWRCRGAAD